MDRLEKETKNKIVEAANCLMGISDDWGYGDIAEFLDWVLDHPEELDGVGYPMEVMKQEYYNDIMECVEVQLVFS